MARLCVNVDHVATVRQARRTVMPDPLEAALLAEQAGACGITIHLREDRRHIQDADVARIKKGIATKLNLEMATAEEIVKIALKTRPYQVTFVPEKRREITTEGGLDVTRDQKRLQAIIGKFRSKGIIVSLFIDPYERQVTASHVLGADAVELNTGAYSEAKGARAVKGELTKLEKAAALTGALGLTTHAGHGLTVANVAPVARIANIEELNIGHSIVSRAVITGFSAATREMIDAINSAGA
ncbi:MAG: pyridoxine 5'-phosphate synthase [Nitrospinae bacterium]|nr:pyridoxine 5'-phosphate synthase [Nitrospinota bacterium]